MTIRPPAVAGLFYPDDPDRLRQLVQDYLAAANQPDPAVPRAIIAPHAGYRYSGPIAGSAYRSLQNGPLPQRAVLLGPAHTLAFRGVAAVTTSGWATPLGLVAVDQAAIAQLRPLPQLCLLDAAHEQEHCLEVQLPFLQIICGAQIAILPLVVGQATGAEVAELLAQLGSDPQTIIVISSDLSHYHDYETARRLDRATAAAITALQPETIGPEQACGYLAIRGLLQWARCLGLRGRTADLRNSGDTAGDRRRVVGYGAFLFGSS
jgi:MEMO1 family protein